MRESALDVGIGRRQVQTRGWLYSARGGGASGGGEGGGAVLAHGMAREQVSGTAQRVTDGHDAEREGERSVIRDLMQRRAPTRWGPRYGGAWAEC